MNEVIDFRDKEIHYIDDGGSDVRLLYILKGELRDMNRPRSELLMQTLTRLSSTYAKVIKNKTNKKDKDKKHIINNDVNVSVVYNDDVLDISNMTVSDIRTGMKLILKDCNFDLIVIVNPPFITSLSVFPRTKLLAGCSIIPIVKTINSTNVAYSWGCEHKGKGLDSAFVVVSNEQHYIPTNDTVGGRIKLYCTPYKDDGIERIMGRTTTLYLNGVISQLPELKILSLRQEFSNTPRALDELRIMTYNILAEPYATSDYAMKKLFNYCHRDNLSTEYRCQLIAKEIISYKSDIICLQECDRKVFDNYYQILFSTSLNYTGTFFNKDAGVAEGCACFINNENLNVLRVVNVPFKNVFKKDTRLNGIYSYRPDIEDVICSKLGTVGQFIVCQSRHCTNQVTIFVNTHLFYHPTAGFIRLLQVEAMIHILTKLKEIIRLQGVGFTFECDVEEDYEACNNRPLTVKNDIIITTMLIGDLNSTPETAAIEYLLSGEITSAHEVWKTINNFKWGKRLGEQENDDKTSGIDVNKSLNCDESILPNLSHHYKFFTAAGYPRFTNYTRDFKDLLDYIFVDDIVEIKRVFPFPDEVLLSSEVALPSKSFPSDHISVVVDLKFKNFT